MTRHRRRPQAIARDLAMRRVRTLTAVAGLGSVAGAGALAVAVANADPAAWSAPAAVQPAKPAVAVPKTHRVPRSLVSTKRSHRHHAAPTVPHTTHRATSVVRPVVHHVAPKPKPVHTSAPAPAPTPTQSATTSGGSHHH